MDTAGLPPLIDVADLATATKLPAEDPSVVLAMHRASGRFRGEVDRTITKVTGEQIWLNGAGTAVLLLPSAPVTEISVTVDGALLERNKDYTLVRKDGRLIRHSGWPYGFENVEVTYTHGYDVVPADIQDAVLEHATTVALTLAHIQQESAGGTQASYGPQAMVGVTQKWSDTVAKYKLRGRH